MADKETFVCALDCMDGRTKDAVKDYAKKHYGVDYVDFITEPGMDRVLANPKENSDRILHLQDMVGISVIHHGAKALLIVGHDKCAGNPVDKEIHLGQIKKATSLVKKWLAGLNAEIPIISLFVEKNNGEWKVTG